MNAGGFLVIAKAFLISELTVVIIRGQAVGTAAWNTGVIRDTVKEIKYDSNLV